MFNATDIDLFKREAEKLGLEIEIRKKPPTKRERREHERFMRFLEKKLCFSEMK